MILFLFSISAACFFAVLSQGFCKLILWMENPKKFPHRSRKAEPVRHFTGLPSREELLHTEPLPGSFRDRPQGVAHS